MMDSLSRICRAVGRTCSLGSVGTDLPRLEVSGPSAKISTSSSNLLLGCIANGIVVHSGDARKVPWPLSKACNTCHQSANPYTPQNPENPNTYPKKPKINKQPMRRSIPMRFRSSKLHKSIRSCPVPIVGIHIPAGAFEGFVNP